MSIEYVCGMILGFLSVYLVCFIVRKLICKRNHWITPEYDERQIIARYKAFRFGFIVLVISILINSIIYEHVSQWCSVTVMSTISIFIALFSFIAVCIFNDAYWGISENKKGSIIIMSIAGVINFLPAVIDWIENKTLLNKEGKFDNLNLVCAIMVFGVEILIVAKKLLCDLRTS